MRAEGDSAAVRIRWATRTLRAAAAGGAIGGAARARPSGSGGEGGEGGGGGSASPLLMVAMEHHRALGLCGGGGAPAEHFPGTFQRTMNGALSLVAANEWCALPLLTAAPAPPRRPPRLTRPNPMPRPCHMRGL